ncbi:Pectin lyase fold/virulence factor, partial [Pleurotus pulmonarius]
MSENDAECVSPDPASTVTDRLNSALNSSGSGFILRLCPNTEYLLLTPLFFSAQDQEISTLGYPLGDERATLVVNGPVSNGTGHTTAIDGTCPSCSGVKLRNLQINGTRSGAPPTQGGANIEMGGSTSGQLIEHVASYNPRSWSCLHIAEGSLDCNNVTVQHNDIGPCGTDDFQQWADGISMSCRNSLVWNNTILDPTDGGIVLFGAPGTVVENNTILVQNQTLLGGINMVDYEPYRGDYSGTVVRNNRIAGAFANTPAGVGETKGVNTEHAIIKIGIAIGPRTWFGDRFGTNASVSGIVTDNEFTGAFSYAMAVSSSRNFTVRNNVLVGNTSFIGAAGPNCSEDQTLP